MLSFEVLVKNNMRFYMFLKQKLRDLIFDRDYKTLSHFCHLENRSTICILPFKIN